MGRGKRQNTTHSTLASKSLFVKEICDKSGRAIKTRDIVEVVSGQWKGIIGEVFGFDSVDDTVDFHITLLNKKAKDLDVSIGGGFADYGENLRVLDNPSDEAKMKLRDASDPIILDKTGRVIERRDIVRVISGEWRGVQGEVVDFDEDNTIDFRVTRLRPPARKRQAEIGGGFTDYGKNLRVLSPDEINK